MIAERYKAGESIEELAYDYDRVPRDIQEAIPCDLDDKAADLGPTAVKVHPVIRQIFIGRMSGLPADRPDDPLAFEGARTIKAWFIGMNPELDDVSAAEVLRSGRVQDVLGAARAFLFNG